MRLSHSDYEACSQVLRRVYSETSLPRFPQRVLTSLMKVVPCGHVSWNTFDQRQQVYSIAYFPDRPELRRLLPQFSATIHTSPLFAHFRTARQFPKRISDLVTLRQFRETAIYQEFYRHVGTRHQMVFSLRGRPVHIALALNRPVRDFSDRDRAVLAFLSPHLAQAYENARIASELPAALETVGEGLDSIRRGLILTGPDGIIRWANPLAREWLAEFFGEGREGTARLPGSLQQWIRQNAARGPADTVRFWERQLSVAGNRLVVYCGRTHTGEFLLSLLRERAEVPPEPAQQFNLTPREAEVLYWISESKTNPEIAVILDASVRTIHKHMEHLFAKLNVENRLAAQRLGLELRRV